MTIQQVNGAPFDENSQTVIRTNENYTMNNSDDIVDVPGPNVTIKFPPQPLVGQRLRIMAPTFENVFIDGNGHLFAGGASTGILPGFGAHNFTFSSALVWVSAQIPA